MAIIEATSDGVKVFIKVVPNASLNEVFGVVGDRLKVRVQSPPESGKANKAVCLLLASALGLNKNTVYVLSGNTNAKKTIGILGVSVDTVFVSLGLK